MVAGIEEGVLLGFCLLRFIHCIRVCQVYTIQYMTLNVYVAFLQNIVSTKCSFKQNYDVQLSAILCRDVRCGILSIMIMFHFSSCNFAARHFLPLYHMEKLDNKIALLAMSLACN